MLNKHSRILLVEDEKLTSLVIQKKLENLGYEICGSVTRGEDAVEEAGDKRPDLVLMDIQLKGQMDGIEAARIIHDRYKIPIIYVTAYSDLNTIERAKLAEPYGYIIKPVNDKELHTTIEIALYKHTSEQELKKSREQLRALAARIQTIREEERTRIAREIHDELGQTLTCMKMDAIWLERKLREDQKDLKEKTLSTIELIDATINTVRRISSELRPGVLDNLGLFSAIEWQAKEFEKRTGVMCYLDIPAEPVPMEQEISTALFRIFQETLTNITRHAEADRVKIKLYFTPGTLMLEVSDNGKGMSEVNKPTSLGILGMKERAVIVGGTVNIESKPGSGTKVKVSIPFIKNQNIYQNDKVNYY